jgi:hypothetical protein
MIYKVLGVFLSFGYLSLFSSSNWIQSGADIDGKAAGYTNGFSVSLSANATRVAIGAPAHDGAGAPVQVTLVCLRFRVAVGFS